MSPPSKPCPQHRRRRWSEPPVRSVEDALEVVRSVAADPRRAETIALVMDASRRGGLCIVVSGTVEPDSVSVVADFLLDTVVDHPGRVDAVVVASTRPGRVGPEADDHWRWFELRDRFDVAGIDLLDWLVIGDTDAVSMAQLTDSRSLW